MVIQMPDGTVEFTFISPHAERVQIAGDFNGWQPTFEMTKLDGQRWRSRLQLGPGVYQFRYRADGQWFNDYAAFGLEHGPFGLNSVVKVGRAKRRPPARAKAVPTGSVGEGSNVLPRAGVPRSSRTSTEADEPNSTDIYRIASPAMAAAS